MTRTCDLLVRSCTVWRSLFPLIYQVVGTEAMNAEASIVSTCFRCRGFLGGSPFSGGLPFSLAGTIRLGAAHQAPDKAVRRSPKVSRTPIASYTCPGCRTRVG